MLFDMFQTKLSMIYVAVLAITACATAVPVQNYHELQHAVVQHKNPPIPILKQDYQRSKDGYQFSYETGNGIHVQETGYLKSFGDKKHSAIVQQGSVTYHDEHGRPITLTYIADENGFQPQGAHLPTPPPIPHEIQKSLEHQSAIAQQQPELQQHIAEDEYVQQQYAEYQ